MAENRQEQGGAQPQRRRQRRRERRARGGRDAAPPVDPIDQNGVPALPALANDLLGPRPRGTRRERSFLGHLFVEERQPATEDSPAKIRRTLYVHYEMSEATLQWFQDNIVHQPVEVARPVPEHCAGHPHPAIATLRKMLTAAYGNACAGRSILIVGGSLVRTSQALAHAPGRPTVWSVHHPPWQAESKYSPQEDRAWWTQHHVNPPPEVDAIDHHEWNAVIYDCNWWDMPQELWDQVLRDVEAGCRIYLLATEVDIRREGTVFGGEVTWRNRVLTYGTDAPTPWGIVARGTATVTTPFGPMRVTPFVRLGSVVYAHGIYRLQGPGTAPQMQPLPLDLQDDWRMYTWVAPRAWSPLGFPIVWGRETRTALLPARVVSDACSTALRASTQDRHWLTALRNYVDEKLRARKTDDHHLVCENIVSYAQAQRRIVTANAAQHYEQSDVRNAEDRLFEGRVLDWRIVAMWAAVVVGAVAAVWYARSKIRSTSAWVMGRVRPGAVIVARHPKWDEAVSVMPYRAIGVVSHRPLAIHDSCWGVLPEWVQRDVHPGAIAPPPPYDRACQPHPRLVQCGPALASVTPTVCRACVHNEYAAVVNRVTEPRLEADIGDWQRIMRQLRWRPLACAPQPRQAWLARFPQGKRASLQCAIDHFGWRPDLTHAAHQVRLMVKIEKMLKPRDEEGNALPYVARAIVFMPEKFQVATGPWSVGLDKRLAREWDGEVRAGRRLLYASGRDGVGYGEWWQAAINSPTPYSIAVCGDNCYILVKIGGGLHAFELDLVHCDSAQGIPQLSVKCATYRRLGAPRYYCAAQLERIFKQGWTRHGLWFQAVGVTDTGNNDTKLGNSLLVGSCLDYIVRQAQCDAITPEQFATHVEEACALYGYPVTLKHDAVDQTPFCSALWVPTAHGTTLTQMPGRWLAKSGFTVHCQNPAKSEQWLRGAMLPAVRDFNHVPALQRLARHLCNITRGRPLSYRFEREWQWHVSTVQNPDIGRLNDWWLRRYGHEYHEFSNAIDWLVRHLSQPTVTYWHPVIARVVERDTLLPGDWIDDVLALPHDPRFNRERALHAVTEITHITVPIMEEGLKNLCACVLNALRVPWRLARLLACTGFGVMEWWSRRTCPLEYTAPALCMHAITGLYDQGGATAVHSAFNQCARLSVENPVMGGVARLLLQVAFIGGLAQNLLPPLRGGGAVASASYLMRPCVGFSTPRSALDFDAVAFIHRVRRVQRRSASCHTTCWYPGRSTKSPARMQNGQGRRRRQRRRQRKVTTTTVSTQAAPARRQQRRRKPGRGRGNGQPLALNYSGVPRSEIRGSILSKEGYQEIRGIEVLDELSTPGNATNESNSKLTKGYLINPRYQFFQRLSGLAQSYQKFRFAKFRFIFNTLVEATCTGVVSCAWVDNPRKGAPTSPPDYASYQCGFSGSVVRNHTTAWQTVRDPRWFYLTPYNSEDASTDPTSYHQGVMWTTVEGAVTADLERRVGYISMEYVLGLDNLQPVDDVTIALQPRSTTVTSGAAAVVPWDTWLSGIGDFGWRAMNAVLSAPFGTQFEEQVFFLDEGDYEIGYLLDYTGASMAFDEVKTPRRATVAQRREVTWVMDKHAHTSENGHWELAENGVRLDHVPAGWTAQSEPRCACVHGGVFTQPCRHTTSVVDRLHPPQPPNAANDITHLWQQVTNSGVTSTVRTLVENLAGAGVVRDAFKLTVAAADAPVKLLLNWDTDGTETRTMNGVDSYFNMTSIGDQ